MKAIIIYYSRSGNTEKYAKQLHADLGFDLIKIEPEKAYGSYIMSCFRVLRENATKTIPKFVTPVPDLSGYDTIFLGFPIWVEDVPSFVQDFIRKCDTDGKTIIPFATYGKSGIDCAMKTLNKLFPHSKIMLPFGNGGKITGNYKKWLSDIKTLG